MANDTPRLSPALLDEFTRFFGQPHDFVAIGNPISTAFMVNDAALAGGASTARPEPSNIQTAAFEPRRPPGVVPGSEGVPQEDFLASMRPSVPTVA